VTAVGADILHARELGGLSRRAVSVVTGVSESAIRRIEGGDLRELTVERLWVVADAVGLEASLRLYQTGAPVRDVGHLALLERLHARLGPPLEWRTEVPVAGAGDVRSWDAVIRRGPRWRPVEAEVRLTDLQALDRKLHLKERDGQAEGLILLVSDTRTNRAVLAGAPAAWTESFPVRTRAALRIIGAGELPEGRVLIVL
jgi:transcriptional regulator with XRE-family HTH domain